MPIIDKLALIEIQKKRVLSCRTKGNTIFYLPGGKREKGESDSDALIRECKEELNVDLTPNSLKLYGVFSAQAHEHPEGVMVQMSCYTAAYKSELKASSEIEEIAWLGMEDKARTSLVDHIIMDQLHAENLID